jgi:(p)ppGpp synthase/HD superfamily hydrolase
MIFDALEFAAAAHRGQYRKGTRIPYIVHPLGVARTLIELNCADEVVVAGLLHDTVEDAGVTLEEIESRFGSRVAVLVSGASEPDKTAVWEQRKSHTLDILRETPDTELLLLSCADKLDNIRALRSDLGRVGEEAFTVFKRPRDKQRWYYESLARVFGDRLMDGPGRGLAAAFCGEVRAVFGMDGDGNQ